MRWTHSAAPALVLWSLLASAGCATVMVEESDEVARAQEDAARYFGALPPCSDEEKRGARTSFDSLPLGPSVQVQGVLRRADPTCTLKGCESRCCNSCGGHWVLAPVDGSALNVILPLADGVAPTWDALDCALPQLMKQAGQKVVGTGELQTPASRYSTERKYELVLGRLCRAE